MLTDGHDEAAISRGIYDTYTQTNLRYSQMAPLSMYEEANTRTNLPAQIELYAKGGDEYHLLYITKGGAARRTRAFLYQETRAVLNPDTLLSFLDEKMRSLGTAACPPYHLAIVIGGTSAEMTLKTVKLASCRYLDTLPTTGNALGRAFRDVELEREVLKRSRELGIGAQFGGKYFCHDIRVIRMPRHGASLPVGIGVSCSADRQAHAKITRGGDLFLEQLETNPARFLPEVEAEDLSADVVSARSQSTDERAPTPPCRSYPDQDATLAHRIDHRGPRHRPRETERAHRPRAKVSPSISRTTSSTTQVRPRHRRGTPPAPLAPRPPAAWIPMSTSSCSTGEAS